MKPLHPFQRLGQANFYLVILSEARFAERRISPRLLPLLAGHCPLITDHSQQTGAL